jgi:hypothetical protein
MITKQQNNRNNKTIEATSNKQQETTEMKQQSSIETIK